MDKRPGQIVTFYSYKGGTGRSLCLANLAVRLARKHDRRVIAIDWDLDAPGLHQYFRIPKSGVKRRPGVIDYLQTYRENYKKGLVHCNPPLEDYLGKAANDLDKQLAVKGENTFSSLRIMTAGKFNKSFRPRVADLDWNLFFEEEDGAEAMDVLRAQLKEAADLILIDARSGVTDLTSVPLLALPDRLVVFFGANRQDMEGTRGILNVVAKARKEKHTPLRADGVLLVPSRIPTREMPEAFERWRTGVGKDLLDFAVEAEITTHHQHPKGIGSWTLPFQPSYAFCENDLSPDPRGTGDELHDKYAYFAERLAAGIEEPFVSFKELLSLTKEIESVETEQLEALHYEAKKRGDVYLQWRWAQRRAIALASTDSTSALRYANEALLLANQNSSPSKYNITQLLVSTIHYIRKDRKEVRETLEQIEAHHLANSELLLIASQHSVYVNDFVLAERFVKEAAEYAGPEDRLLDEVPLVGIPLGEGGQATEKFIQLLKKHGFKVKD